MTNPNRNRGDPGLEAGVITAMVMAALMVVGGMLYLLNSPAPIKAAGPGAPATGTVGEGGSPPAQPAP